jgi:formylglycine-generating enzyme required for sulfatase activity
VRDLQQPTAARIRAGFALGRQGDPRFPVDPAEWREELKRLQHGQSDGYFCYVPAGRYIIGSSDDDPEARDNEKPQYRTRPKRDFWVARYPITNEQWQQWVREGGTPSHYADDKDYNHPNQPVVGVSWEECRDFCGWLTQALQANIRLPSEAEWEAAAQGPIWVRYTWGNKWHTDHAASQDYGEAHSTHSPVPVGCYPLGAAQCGALDMLGNVWEWVCSPWTADHTTKQAARQLFRLKPNNTTYFQFTVKGGSYRTRPPLVRCAARSGASRDARDPDIGFRVVVSSKK